MRSAISALLLAGVVVLLGVVAHADPSEQRLLALSAVLAIVAGLSATAVGVFGAILVPGLLLLGVDPRVAAGISLLLQATVLPLGAGAHLALGNVRRAIVVPLMAGGIGGALLGVVVASRIPAALASRSVAVVIVVIGILVLATLFARPRRATQTQNALSHPNRPIAPARPRLAGAGVLAGIAMGVSGAGWGPISVKLLLLGGVEPRLAVGSSLVGRVGVALSAVGAYAASAAFVERVGVDLQLVAVLALGSALAVGVGSLVITTAGRRRAVLAIVLLSISLALPSALGVTL